MRAPRGRLLLLLQLQLVGITAASSALLLAVGLPLLARRALGPSAYALLVLGAAFVGVVAGSILLSRAVAEPVERLLAAAARLRDLPRDEPELPVMGEAGGDGLSRAAVAFERLVGALSEERQRLAWKVEELTRANQSLAEARASLLRSERLATVGLLASGLAHEVGNPLGAIVGYSELARAALRRSGDVATLELVERIDEAGHRIDRTVRGLLEFARPAVFALGPVEVAPAVESALRLARVQPRFKAVEVELELPSELPSVVADEHHLAQVLLNLLLNAGDAMDGRGRVRVAARLLPGDPSRAELTVEDDGPGIPPGDLQRIFDPFFTTKPPGEGTGLGLAVSQSLVEALGGELAARNGPARGAVFSVILAVAPASPAAR